MEEPKAGDQGRHHVHQSTVGKVATVALRKAGLAKRATRHTFRHSFATHLRESDCNIRTTQARLHHRVGDCYDLSPRSESGQQGASRDR